MGIDAWVVKGADLAQTAYPDPGLRSMGDVDILLAREHLLDALSAASSMGWSVRGPGDALLTSGTISSATAGLGRARIDFHTHLLHFPATLPGRLAFPAAEGSRPTPLGLLSPAPELELLYVLLHMLTHSRIRQIWWIDAALLASRLGREGWRRFTRMARESGTGRALASSMIALQSVTGVNIPEPCLSVLESSYDRSGALRLLRGGRGRPTAAFVLAPGGSRRLSYLAALWAGVLTRRTAATARVPGWRWPR